MLNKLRKTTFMLLIVLIFLTSGTVKAADEYIEGNGEAILGSGMTMEQAKEIALQNAQRDAISKFGVYIESEQVVEDYTLVKDKITSITASTVKIKAGSKKVDRDWNNEIEVMQLRVEAIFIINRNDFEERIEQYIERQSSDDEMGDILSKIDELEKQIDSYSRDKEDVSFADVQNSLDELKNLYRLLDNRLEVSGEKIIFNIEQQRLERLTKLRNYLEELKTVADPYEMFELSIGDLEVKDRGEGKIQVGVPIEIELNQDYYRRSLRIIDKYKDAIYPDDGEIDNINERLLEESVFVGGSNYVVRVRRLRAPMLVTFLNDNNEIVAFYLNSDIGLYAYLHRNRVSHHNIKMKISDYDIPENKISNSLWRRELPEDIVKEISSVKVIFCNNQLRNITSEYNYERYGTYMSRRAYIYSFLPTDLSEIKLTEADVLAEIDKRIANVNQEIAELKGEDEKKSQIEINHSTDSESEVREEITNGEEIETEQEDSFHLNFSYTPLSISGEANNVKWYTDDSHQDLIVDYTNYNHLSEGAIFSIARSFTDGDFSNNSLGGSYYFINKDIHAFSLDYSYKKKNKMVWGISSYWGLDAAVGRFSLKLEDNEMIKVLEGHDINSVNKGFASLGGHLGLNLKIKRINLFSDVSYRHFFSGDNWRYRIEKGDDSEFIDIEGQYLPYSEINIENTFFRFGIGVIF